MYRMTYNYKFVNSVKINFLFFEYMSILLNRSSLCMVFCRYFLYRLNFSESSAESLLINPNQSSSVAFSRNTL